MTTRQDLSTMNMSETRTYVRELINTMAASMAQYGLTRADVVRSCREAWTEDAKRAAFNDTADDGRTTYLPMMLEALKEETS